MSLIRTAIVLAAVIMVLPLDEKKQAELASSASRTAEQTASFCERNPSTCAAGREMWSLFLRKAEYGMELAARLAREQLGRALAPQPQQAEVLPDAQAQPGSVPAFAPAPLRIEPLPAPATTQRAEAAQRRNAYPMDNASRWR